MRYEPTFWENGKTPLNDDNLNKIETGLSNLSENVEELSNSVESLSTTMENGLTEVKEDIEELKNKVDVDITEGSTTTLTNSFDGGLRFREISNVKGKNRLNCSGLTAQTSNGVTFTPVYDTNNNLLYVNVNGKATANTEYKVADLTTFDGTLGNEYIFNGCPSGGSTSTYCMFYLEWDSNWGALNRIADTGSDTNIKSNVNTAYMNVRIYIQNGYTANNLRFYPMIRTSGDSSYVPYGLIGLNTHGKNLAKTCIYGTNIASNYGGLVRQVEANNIKAGKTYTMSVELTASSNTSAYWNTGSGLIASPINFNITAGTKRYSHTFVATKDYENVVNSWLSKQGTSDNVAITASNFQIEEGTATEYESYQESVVYLTDIELNDGERIVNKDGKYVIERNGESEVLPTADQIALNSLLTFDGVTYLSIESELEPQFTLEYGTSKVGGYTLKSLNTAEANTARLNAIETLTSNLATAIL